MTRYKNVKFVLISPEELRLPQFVIDDYLEEADFDMKSAARSKRRCRSSTYSI